MHTYTYTHARTQVSLLWTPSQTPSNVNLSLSLRDRRTRAPWAGRLLTDQVVGSWVAAVWLRTIVRINVHTVPTSSCPPAHVSIDLTARNLLNKPLQQAAFLSPRSTTLITFHTGLNNPGTREMMVHAGLGAAVAFQA